jgi:hypothetical protein
MSATTEQFHGLVHAAVNEITQPRSSNAAPAALCPEQVLGVCGHAAAETWDSERWRWRGHEAARLVASYLAFLQPPEGWRRADGTLGEPGAYLVWRDEDTVMADVLSTRARGSSLWTRHDSGLPRRLVRAGRHQFGDGFVGVRVLALAAPGASLLVDSPTGPPTPLVGTPWAWWPQTGCGQHLAAAAAGEVAS